MDLMKRKITESIDFWRRTKTNQGLLITGARQVGKTSSILEFAQREYSSVIKIDFVERPEAVRVITEAKNLDDLLMRITALATRPLPDGKTLLFFDEVQQCEEAVTWMRYLAADGRFDVIYSGSMLGVSAYDFRSLPAGTLDVVEMFPMDLQEFSWAMGVDDSLWELARECFVCREEVPDFVHGRLMDCFMRYVLIGGMPDAVQVFCSTHDTQAMRARQNGIRRAYRHDIKKYVKDPVHAQRIQTIYDALPGQLAKDNKRFVVSGIDKRKRFDEMRPDFDWLKNAGVALPVVRSTEATFPLGLSEEGSFFKFYMSDVGLLFSTFAPVDVEGLLLAQDSINMGSAYENAVAQELRAHGYETLRYFSTKTIGEVDFLLEGSSGIGIRPVEVKSGKISRKHAALDALLAVDNFVLEDPLVLHTRNVEVGDSVTYLPIYMVAFL